jgi:hypothetical protein
MDTHFETISQLFLFMKYPSRKQNKLGRSIGFGSLAAVIVSQRKKYVITSVGILELLQLSEPQSNHEFFVYSGTKLLVYTI